MDFINKKKLPEKYRVTYAIFLCEHHPLKTKQYIVILVFGGDFLVYEDNPGYPVASIIDTKLLPNSIIYDSQQGAIFMRCDIEYFFLSTPMLLPEFMKIHIFFPQDII